MTTASNADGIVLEGGRVLENAGTFNVTGGRTVFDLGYDHEGTVGGGTIKNDSGATFDFQGASTIRNVEGTNAFVNAGTLEGTVATGTADIGVAVTNTGTVSVKTGTLELSGGGSATAGAFKVASGATLDFGGGTFTLSGGSYDASGTTEISGGTTNFAGATIVSLGALDVTGGTIAINSSGAAASLTQTGGAIGGTGKLTISGAATFSGSSFDVQSGTGTTLLEGVTTASNADGIVLEGGRVLENAGTFNVTGGALFDAEGGTIKNDKGATFDFQGASTIRNISGTNAFVNAGTLEGTAAAGAANIRIAVNNTGTISAKTGTLELSGGGSSTAGTLTVASGATLDFGGGTFTLSAGSYNASGTTEISGGTTTFAGATIVSLGALDVRGESTLALGSSGASATSLTQTGGTIDGTGTLTVTGSATFAFSGGGTLAEVQSGTGTTLLEGVTSDSSGDLVLEGGRVLENAGSFDVMGGAVFRLGGGTIKNDKGATFDFQTAATIINSSGTNAFVNAGTLEGTLTTGTADIGVAVTNTGTISVKTGTLELSGGGSSTAGTFKVASGATLDFGGGTFTLSGGSYDASGTTEISGGTTTFAGATIVSLGALDVRGESTLALGSSGASATSLTQTGGTIDGTGTLTISGAATISGGGGGNLAEVQSGTGTTLLEGVTSDSSGDLVLEGGRVLENAGSFDVMGGAVSTFVHGRGGGDTIKNDTGATFDFQSASTIFNQTGTNAFVNAGTLEGTVATGMADIGVAVTNTGTVSVKTGTLELSGGLTNLSGSTLTGGAYSVSAGAVLELANNATIVTDDANITLRGKGSTIQSLVSGGQVSFDNTLRTIGAAGKLHLLAGRNLTTAAAAIRDKGLIELGGGALTVTGKGSLLTIGVAGKLLGFGVVNATTLTNSGLIEASGGTLTVQNAVKGKGGVQIDAKATLALGGSTASGSTATFNGAGATLTLDKPASFASTIGGFGLDDAFDLVGVTANAAKVNGSNQLVVTENGTTVDTLQLSGTNSGFYFLPVAVSGGTDIISLPIPATVADYLDAPSLYDAITGGFAISDTAANISASLNSLNDTRLNSITISDNGAVVATVAQLTSDATELGKLKNANATPYQLAITDSLPDIVNDLSGLNGNSHISSLTGTSGAATLSSGATVAAPAFTLTGSSTALTLAEILTYSGRFSAQTPVRPSAFRAEIR